MMREILLEIYLIGGKQRQPLPVMTGKEAGFLAPAPGAAASWHALAAEFQCFREKYRIEAKVQTAHAFLQKSGG
jgi:hypothetical protein